MKLYTVKIVGIGPFAEPIDIDFRRFDDSGLFLLRGPTGSGKTTILDAIAFALYGEVTKDGKNSDARLRSHYLSDKERSEVELVFGTAEGIFRVVREPAFQKAGNKSTTAAKATLTQVVPDSEGNFVFQREVAVGPRQVGPEITRLIGLNCAQFLQTIILPQGQFAKFLSASSQDRQKILQSIFGTQRFHDYQKRLMARASAAMERIAAHQNAVSTAYDFALSTYTAAESATLSAFGAQELSEQSELLFPPFPDEDSLLSSVDTLRHHVEQVRCAVHSDTDAHAQRVRRLRDEHERAQAGLRMAAEHDKLTARSQQLAQQADDIAADETVLSQALAVEPLREPLRQAEESWKKFHTARSGAARAVVALQQAGVIAIENNDIDALTQHVNEVLASLQQETGSLKPLLIQETEFDVQQQALASRQKTLDKQRQDLKKDRQALTGLPEKIRSLAQQYTADFALSEKEDALSQSVAMLGRRLDAAQHIPVAETVLTHAQDALTEHIRSAEKAHATARQLRAQWMADAAASLAGELKQGAPCMVCGSSEHPQPARAHSGNTVTHADVEAAQLASQSADQSVAAAQDEVALKNKALAELQATAQGSLADAQEAYSQAETELSQAKAAAARLESTKAEHEKAEGLKEALEQSIAELERSIASEESAIHTEQQTLAGIEERLQSARGEFDSIRDRATALSVQEERVTACRDQLALVQQFMLHWQSCTEQLDRVVQTLSDTPLTWDKSAWSAVNFSDTATDVTGTVSGANEVPGTGVFLSRVLPTIVGEDGARILCEYAAQLIPSTEVESLRDRISTYHHTVKLTAEALADEKFASLTGEEAQIAQEAAARMVAADEEHTAYLQRMSAVSAALQALLHALDVVEQRHEELATAQAGSEAVVRLARMASGDPKANNATIPLSSWVLISLFGDVLEAANHHLRAISAGRYALETQVDNGDKRTRSGLDLMLVDDDVDELKRYPETLSGGETFYVSLALALGLSEIVTGEKGGIDIKSMFIDEGFGTLDPHTLDAVMEVLHQLRQDDRTIGIISHVEDLEKRIPEQIVVSKKDTGGSTLTVRA